MQRLSDRHPVIIDGNDKVSESEYVAKYNPTDIALKIKSDGIKERLSKSAKEIVAQFTDDSYISGEYTHIICDVLYKHVMKFGNNGDGITKEMLYNINHELEWIHRLYIKDVRVDCDGNIIAWMHTEDVISLVMFIDVVNDIPTLDGAIYIQENCTNNRDFDFSMPDVFFLKYVAAPRNHKDITVEFSYKSSTTEDKLRIVYANENILLEYDYN